MRFILDQSAWCTPIREWTISVSRTCQHPTVSIPLGNRWASKQGITVTESSTDRAAAGWHVFETEIVHSLGPPTHADWSNMNHNRSAYGKLNRWGVRALRRARIVCPEATLLGVIPTLPGWLFSFWLKVPRGSKSGGGQCPDPISLTHNSPKSMEWNSA